VARYLKNYAVANGFFDEIGMVQEAIGIGSFEHLVNQLSASFRYDPSRSYSEFGLAVVDSTGLGDDLLTLVFDCDIGNAAILQTALTDAGYSDTQAAAFIERMAEVFAYESLQSLKETFSSEDPQTAIVNLLTTPTLENEIEDMVFVAIECYGGLIGYILQELSTDDTDFAFHMCCWVLANYMQNFAAINDITIPSGTIAPDSFQIKNYELKEELAQSGITIAFAEAEGIDPGIVDVDSAMMQTLVDAIMVQDMADLGGMVHSLLLREDVTTDDVVVFSLLCTLLNENPGEQGIITFVDTLRTIASFPSEERFTELEKLGELVEQALGEMEDVGFVTSAGRIVKGFANHFLEKWDAITLETGELFEEEDDTLERVLSWVTLLYIQNLAALNAEEISMGIKSNAAVSKRERLDNKAVARQVVTEEKMDAVIETFSLDKTEMYDKLDLGTALNCYYEGELESMMESVEIQKFVIEPVNKIVADLVVRITDDSSDDFALAEAVMKTASAGVMKSSSGCVSSGSGSGSGSVNSAISSCVSLVEVSFDILYACTGTGRPFLNLDRDLWLPKTAAETISVSVGTNREWDVFSNESWIAVSKLDDSTFTITVTASGSFEREGTVIVDAGNGLIQEIIVSQSNMMHVTTPEAFEQALKGEGQYSGSGRYIRLQSDIDLGEDWDAINLNNANFTLDGNGYTVTFKSRNNFPNSGNSNNSQAEMNAGLLGKVTDSTITIKKLSIVGSAVVASEYNGGEAQVRAGGLAALVSGGSFTVENTCFVSANEGVRAERDRGAPAATAYAGGFFGEVNGAAITIRNCFVNTEVTADTRVDGSASPKSYAGGFTGRVAGGSIFISNSYAAGTVNAYATASSGISADEKNYAGGLVGKVENNAVNTIDNNTSYRFNRVIWLYGSASHNENQSGKPIVVNNVSGKPIRLSDAINAVGGVNGILRTLEGTSNGDWQYSGDGLLPTLAGVPKTPQRGVLDGVLTKVANTYTAMFPYKDVAEMCIQLAGFDVYYHDAIENKLVNRAGFTGFDAYQYETIPVINGAIINNTAQHAFAHKKMPNGTTVVIVAVRGTGTEHGIFESADTWLSNFNSGLALFDEHPGFSKATNDVFKNLKSYLWGKNLTKFGSFGGTLKDNVKIVITGHSRGAAVGNLLTERLHTKYDIAKIQKRLFNYNFATPRTIGNYSARKSSANILNINNTNDSITTDLPHFFSWWRHGRDITFEKEGDLEVSKYFGKSLGNHRAELYQREIIRNEGINPRLG